MLVLHNVHQMEGNGLPIHLVLPSERLTSSLSSNAIEKRSPEPTSPHARPHPRHPPRPQVQQGCQMIFS